MSVRLFAFTCGWLTMPKAILLEGAEGTLRVPVPCYLVDHPKGKVLFDSGMSLAAQAAPEAYLGGMTRLFRLEFEAGQEVAARLAALEVEAADIRYLVNSHLHFDHAGGNGQIPDAPLIVQRPEWEFARSDEAPERGGYKPEDYDLGHDLMPIEGEHDLFGDETVVCIPTYGHTPGHQSLRVRTEGGELVLAADACYLRESLERMHLPGYPYDRAAALRVLETLRRLRNGGARIFYGHDPAFWAGVPKAPAAVT